MKAAAVLEYVFPGVPFGKAEIEDFLAVDRADTAGPSAEAVDEPREFCEGGHLEDSYAAYAMLGPRRAGADGGARFADAALSRY